jgi:hypothetical protein
MARSRLDTYSCLAKAGLGSTLASAWSTPREAVDLDSLLGCAESRARLTGLRQIDLAQLKHQFPGEMSSVQRNLQALRLKCHCVAQNSQCPQNILLEETLTATKWTLLTVAR